jgi:anhydro-N-acetylmuramic acid kinase
MATPRYFIGLMSGTSVDAIDAALVACHGDLLTGTSELCGHIQYPWPDALRAELLAVMAPATVTTQQICRLHDEVAREFAHAVAELLRTTGVTASAITAIGSHGQTVCHLPPTASNPAPGCTLQLGSVSTLAVLTGIPVIGDFRPADMAVGGQGAPLVPWTDALLLQHPTHIRCVQNIGGIGNVTWLPQRDARPSLCAFDTGPGNMLMDAAVQRVTHNAQRYDRGGALARQGRIHAELFASLSADPYFQRPPPKSAGREQFGVALLERILAQFPAIPAPDLIATLTHLTVWSIADAYARYLPQWPAEVIVCGGGAENTYLMEQLHTALNQHQPTKVLKIDDLGIRNAAKEALSFALLAAASYDGIPANVPSVTGASRAVILGVRASGR